MAVILLKIGLGLTSFYELLIKIFPFAGANTPDTRVGKIYIGMMLALAIGLAALFSGEIRACKNKWLLILLFFIPISIHLSPQYEVILNGIPSPNYWVWKPFAMCLCYFLMFIAVQSLNITKGMFKGIVEVMVLCGLAMSGYVLLQNFGWDQFFSKRLGNEFLQVTKPVTVGTLGNSTIVSPYIAMIIPFALYLKRYWVAIVLICAVLVSHSNMAIGAMIVSLMAYSCLYGRARGRFWVLIAVFAVMAGVFTFITLSPEKFDKTFTKIVNTNGRIPVWKGIVKQMKDGEFGAGKQSYPYTGLGPGSYAILMVPALNTKFGQAHNEYLQVFCEMGFIGLGLFLAAIWHMVKTACGNLTPEICVLLSSFLCIALVALGTFIWQIGPIIYLTVIVAGLLHNQNLLKGDI